MKTNKEISQLFKSMQCMPIFEIDLSDYTETVEPGEYTYCYVNYDEQTNMLQYGGCSNAGFYCEGELEYDQCFSTDENLYTLLELFIENSINGYNS